MALRQGGALRPRTQVLPDRITGRIADWKGRFGWIYPDQRVDHPEADMHRGKIYLHQMDVETEIAGVGAHVSFFVYADGTGLGAMNCRPVDGPGVVRTVAKPVESIAATGCLSRGIQGKGAAGKGVQPRPPPVDPSQRQRLSDAPVMGVVQTWRGSFGWISPLEPISHPLFRGLVYVHIRDVDLSDRVYEGVQVSFLPYADPRGIGAEECNITDVAVGLPAQPAGAQVSGKAAGKGARSRLGAAGARERVTTVPVTGEVIEWDGAIGWINPHGTIQHPKVALAEGKLFVTKVDLADGVDLQPGLLVQFHVFVDSRGAGAEECMPF